MSTINLQIVFEGPAVQDGAIDARLFAESIVGYSEIFTRTNAVMNGEASDATVFVQSEFRRGSFIASLELVQNIKENAAYLITAHQFFNAGGLAAVIGFVPAEFAKEFFKDIAKETVIGLYKWLKGKKPNEIRKENAESLEIKHDQESRIVNQNIYNLYGDSAIRFGLDKLTSPLRKAEIDRISVRQNNEEKAVFEKSEAGYFDAEHSKLETNAEEMQGERETVLVISKLSFKENVNWTFFERGATIVAKIEDVDFWRKVHEHVVTFGEGDLLRVRLSWEIWEKYGQLKQKNTVLKVIEKLERPKQMPLNDVKQENTYIVRPRRKFRKELQLKQSNKTEDQC